MRDGDIVKIAVIICAAVLACSASVILFNGKAATDTSIPDYFGLSSTKLTLSTNDANPYQPGTWSLPSGKSYSDIEWSSSDSSVATVDGGKIKGVSTGQATITARLGSYSDTCLVTVDSSTGDRPTYFYNAYSDKFDYARVDGDGFNKGLLSLAFNANGAMVITLAGYDPDWIKTSSLYPGYSSSLFTGNVTADFKTVTMVLKKGEETVASGTYTNEYKGHTSPFDLGNYTLISDKTDTTMLVMDASKLTYGDYSVEFTLTAENGYISSTEYHITGTISYLEGDGKFDTSGTYTRSYAWQFGFEEGSVTKHSFIISYPYSDYWNGYYKNTKLLDKDSSRNYKSYSWVTEFTTSSESVKLLSEAIKTEYGTTAVNDDKFAEFVLAFGQISYEYEYDYSQYVAGTGTNKESSDYWAYSDQTIYSGFGDCEDTSILIASLMKYLGFNTACVVLPSHMTFAVELSEYTLLSNAYRFNVEDKWYYLCETTVHSPTIVRETVTRSTWVPYVKDASYTSTYPVGIISSDYENEEFSYYLL